MNLNTLTLHAINLGILTFLFFIVGMIKPKWALFFMEKPSRWYVTAITTVLFMIFMTMHAQGLQQQKMAKKKKEPAAPSSVPIPVPETVPVPVPGEAKKK